MLTHMFIVTCLTAVLGIFLTMVIEEVSMTRRVRRIVQITTIFGVSAAVIGTLSWMLQ